MSSAVSPWSWYIIRMVVFWSPVRFGPRSFAMAEDLGKALNTRPREGQSKEERHKWQRRNGTGKNGYGMATEMAKWRAGTPLHWKGSLSGAGKGRRGEQVQSGSLGNGKEAALGNGAPRGAHARGEQNAGIQISRTEISTWAPMRGRGLRNGEARGVVGKDAQTVGV